ncbi:TPA: hypothetical protein EYP27_03980 [Candidatus Bathyarchaeota archaeon]|nr:hypothetical protein [Candidatus Bathyarchaeota archaeon]
MNSQWPVKILLVHPQASFLQKSRLTIAADCAVLSSESLGNRFRKGETVIIGCPLLEDPNRVMSKLALVMKEADASEVEVYTMEVPCCHAIHMMVMKAIKEAGKGNVDAKYYIVRVMSGEIEPYKPGAIDESMMEAERRAHGHIH